jgi:hypothetical protein
MRPIMAISASVRWEWGSYTIYPPGLAQLLQGSPWYPRSGAYRRSCSSEKSLGQHHALAVPSRHRIQYQTFCSLEPFSQEIVPLVRGKGKSRKDDLPAKARTGGSFVSRVAHHVEDRASQIRTCFRDQDLTFTMERGTLNPVS